MPASTAGDRLYSPSLDNRAARTDTSQPLNLVGRGGEWPVPKAR